MIGLFDGLIRPLLRTLDPEAAHGLTLKMLKFAPRLGIVADDKRLAVRAFALNFPNPVGMAAGFDKNAEAPDALLRVGFGLSKSAPSRRYRKRAIRARGSSALKPTAA